ncbi:hypothetical protein EAJ04_20515 [Bacteroides faecis]|nr:hypothetical protein EAJ04_20515 [Bacteroides faecis]
MNYLILPNEFLSTLLSSMGILAVLTVIFYIKDKCKLRLRTVMIGSLIIFVACFIPKAINEKSMINYHREKLINLLDPQGVPTNGKINIEIQDDTLLLFHIENDSSTYSFPIKKKINQYVVETARFRRHLN